MIRGLILFFALLGVLFVGIWVKRLRTENDELQAKLRKHRQKVEADEAARPPPAPESAPDSPARQHLLTELAGERQRLADLNKGLVDLQASSAGSDEDSIASHIADANTRITRAKEEMQSIGQDTQIVNQRAKGYRSQEEVGFRSERAQIDQQLQANQAQAQADRANLQYLQKSRTESDRANRMQALRVDLAALKQERESLTNERKSIDSEAHGTSAAISQEVQSEQNEMYGERNQAQLELSRAQADLQHWQVLHNQQNGEAKSRSDRLRAAREAVEREKFKIQTLEKTLADLAR